jgi:hypothetical protein
MTTTQFFAGRLNAEREKLPVERLLVGDVVQAIEHGPLGVVRKTCAEGYAGWMSVEWRGSRGTAQARTMPYKAGVDRLYLVEPKR